ncbi:DcaP family trimeric outer membrane transporter [Cellulophaga sp. L1A9]|uniref:DcaP family trimeric outer membrane transporter n=1 Tax=Cellulophaga sp. L1A9 TaxID=2686362 RepID=UPI00131B03D1|nr:DcaP family trimeric outer membrane transporter [Cellulophaga sp. L1A9]
MPNSFRRILMLCISMIAANAFSQSKDQKNISDTLLVTHKDVQDPIKIKSERAGFRASGKTKKIALDFIGYVKLIGGLDLGNIQNTSEFYPSKIPIYPTLREEKPRSFLDARQTRLAVDGEYEISDSNKMHLYVEIDFFNTEAETSFVPHLRHAYGEYKGFLIGQTWSTMKNGAAFPVQVDFEGPNSITGPRNPMVRYTHVINNKYSYAVAMETHSEDYTPFDTNPDDTMAYLYVPDLIGYIQKGGAWGNLRISGILKNMSYTNANSSAIKSMTGGGAEISGIIKFFNRNEMNDDVRFGYTYGLGIAYYINDLRGQGLDAAPNENGEMTSIPAMGGFLAYKHSWSKTATSSAVFSFTSIDNSDYTNDEMYDFSSYGAVNYIWSPIDRIDYGVELIYGKNQNKLGDNGIGYRAQFMAIYHL